MSNNAHDLSKRLLGALDEQYNVIDMRTVNEIISILETISITKELLETTRLGKHVNELRRKAKDPTLARRAKVLVKKWRDLVIPSSHNTPTHSGSHGRPSEPLLLLRGGNTPLTSPALSRVASVSPALSASPHRNLTTKVWNVDNDDSDSNDVILVDDDPPSAPLLPRPLDTNRISSPVEIIPTKKPKKEKKPKKKRAHGRAGSDAEPSWAERNGRNGTRKHTLAGLVLPAPGSKKVKTTQELLEDIQSRLHDATPSRTSSPDCEVISVQSPSEAKKSLVSPVWAQRAEDSRVQDSRGEADDWPVEEEEELPSAVCICGEESEPECPAAVERHVESLPHHVRALHNTLIANVNGNHGRVIVPDLRLRPVENPEKPDLFASVVPLYRYLDYTRDRTVKNLSAVSLDNEVRLNYGMTSSAPVVRWPGTDADLQDALDEASATTERDNLGRPIETDKFAEWHEPVRLRSGLNALPYVVID